MTSQPTTLSFAKRLVALNGLIPFALLATDALRGQLGANPARSAIHTTGLLALIFLCVSLAITPARLLTGFNWLIAFRRSLGLYAFFYAALHFGIFFVWDRQLSLASTVHEIATRFYLLVGAIALVIMAPLAATSTNAAVKRLGGQRWRLLHQLVYLSVIGAALHFYLQAKSDKRLPTAFAAAVALLLGYRLVAHYLRLWRDGTPGQAITPIPVSGKPQFWTGHLRVARKFEETPSVRTFRLVSPDGGDLPFAFAPGQYLNLSLTIDGKRVNRSYTIASPPTRRGSCELTIKREQTGVASRHLHDMLHEGDLLKVSAPAGRFIFTGNEADHVVLIAAGVGITPLMSVIRHLTDHCWPGDIFLIYAARTRAEIIFQDELTTLTRRFPNFHLTVTLSRETDPAWTGPRGRITPDLLQQAVSNWPARLVHLCGPADMMPAATQLLLDLDVPPARIKTETFAPAGQLLAESTEAPAPETPSSFPESALVPTPLNGDGTLMTFATSGKSIRVDANTSVLEAAEAAGVSIDYDCRSGICGTCKTKLLAGRVTMETRDGLTRTDIANHLVLACQAKPLEDLTLSA